MMAEYLIGKYDELDVNYVLYILFYMIVMVLLNLCLKEEFL